MWVFVEERKGRESFFFYSVHSRQTLFLLSYQVTLDTYRLPLEQLIQLHSYYSPGSFSFFYSSCATWYSLYERELRIAEKKALFLLLQNKNKKKRRVLMVGWQLICHGKQQNKEVNLLWAIFPSPRYFWKRVCNSIIFWEWSS